MGDKFIYLLLIACAIPVIIVIVRRATRYDPKKINWDKVVQLAYYHYNIRYLMSLKGNVVTQQWVIDKHDFDKKTKNLRAAQKSEELDRHKSIVKYLNKEGLKAPQRPAQIYPGFIEYRLGRGNKLPNFTKQDYIRFKELRKKCSLLNVVQTYKAALPPRAWNNAFFRRDLYYWINGLNSEEENELKDLIFKKFEYTNKHLKINALSPFEDQFDFVWDIMYRDRTPDFGKFTYEFELPDFKDRPPYWTDNHEDVLSSDNGVYVGGGQRFPDQGHFMTIGATRKGKGTNLIIPHILEPEKFDGSQVIMDIKGELAAICARYLKSVGKKVIILDPWRLQNHDKISHGIEPSSFNPLEFLDKTDPNFIDDCKEIATNLVEFDKSESQDSHWVKRARNWVSYYLMWMGTSMDKKDVTLRKLLSLFSYNQDDRIDLFADMQAYGEFEAIKENGSELMDMFNNAPKESQSILSTVKGALETFQSPMMEKVTSESNFDLQDIVNGDYYIFICIPAERVSTHFRWLRLVLGSITRVALRNNNKRVLMIMDEFAQLGRLPIVEKSFGLMAGFNLSFWIIIQGIDQLQEIYPEPAWKTFFNNAAVTTWIGIEDMSTATHLSNLLGRRFTQYKSDEVIIKELTSSQILPAEKIELRSQTETQIRQADYIYTLVSGLEAIVSEKDPYYETHLNERADPNPYYKGD